MILIIQQMFSIILNAQEDLYTCLQFSSLLCLSSVHFVLLSFVLIFNVDLGFVGPDTYIILNRGELFEENNVSLSNFTKTYNDGNIFLGTLSGQTEV